MKTLQYEATKSTPVIILDAGKNYMEISGQSYPEDSTTFYQPIFAWIKEYLKNVETSQKINVKFKLAYLNTSSSKCVMTILDMLEDAYAEDKKVDVRWHYDEDNDAALESGEDFSEDLDLPFTLVEDND